MKEPPSYNEILSRHIKLPVEDKELGWLIAQKYPYIRSRLDEKQRKAIKEIAIRAILRRALNTLGPTKRSAKLKRETYRFGADEIDLESTLDQILGKEEYQVEDIIVQTREKKKLAGTLMVDTSLSMAGEKLAVASVGASMLALELKDDNYAVVTFESRARVLKAMRERKDAQSVIEELLETPATGDTNMEDGLRVGLIELQKVAAGERLGIMITDGQCTGGFHPEKVAAKYPKLCVMMIESPVSNPGTCALLANLGKGKFYRVKDYYEVPRAIHNLLREFT